MSTTAPDASLHPDMTMDELLGRMPGARRALFAKYHIGGCRSCGFEGSETLADVCRRNDNLDPGEVMAHLAASAEQDRLMQIEPEELARTLAEGTAIRLIDVRSREEHEAVALPGSELMTQELLQQLFAGDKTARVVVYCHHGQRSLDAAAYLAGHGLPQRRHRQPPQPRRNARRRRRRHGWQPGMRRHGPHVAQIHRKRRPQGHR
jgi:rhodanese-related sulfurtransferase